MKYCRNCGKELNSDVQYCPNCGASVSEEQSGENENSYQESNADGSLWESLVEFFKALIEYMKEAGLHIIDAIDKIIQMPPNIPKDSICPYCNSEDTFPIVKNETEIKTKGYSMGRGCCGMCLLGPFGLLCGALFTGSKVKSRSITWWGCKNCGRRERFPESIRSQSDSKIAGQIMNALERGIKMQRRDRSFAKASYSGKSGTISWFMPLHIDAPLSEDPELVMVVRRSGDFYEIKTILSYDDELKDRITALSLYSKLW